MPDVSPATVKNTVSLLRILALALISGAAIASRLFAVVNFESIIHELYVFSFYKYQRNLILVRSLSVIPGSTSE
jgi:dolichyl-diphosphooligosaccharide---protein glycosyltransferase